MKYVFFVVLMLFIAKFYNMDKAVAVSDIDQTRFHYNLNSDIELNKNFLNILYNSSTQTIVIELLFLSEKNGEYEIYNILGKQLLHGQITEKTSTLSISALPKGIYILKVIIDKKQSSKKFIVK